MLPGLLPHSVFCEDSIFQQQDSCGKGVGSAQQCPAVLHTAQAGVPPPLPTDGGCGLRTPTLERSLELMVSGCGILMCVSGWGDACSLGWIRLKEIKSGRELAPGSSKSCASKLQTNRFHAAKEKRQKSVVLSADSCRVPHSQGSLSLMEYLPSGAELICSWRQWRERGNNCVRAG